MYPIISFRSYAKRVFSEIGIILKENESNFHSVNRSSQGFFYFRQHTDIYLL